MDIDIKYLAKRNKQRIVIACEKIMDSLNMTPKDFSWKVRQRMKYDHNRHFIELQDKLKVKAYAQQRGVQTAYVYYVTNQPETIPFGSLPNKYFIKASHGCAWNILHDDGRYYNWVREGALIKRDLSKLNITQAESIRLCRNWLNTTYSKAEWAYQYIEPLIIVEEKLESDDDTEGLVDYRCYVFDGEVKVIDYDSPMYDVGVDLFVDVNWEPFDLPGHFAKPPDPMPKKPKNLQEIVKAAERLGKGYDFLRIDLFCTAKGIVLGEMAIYPDAGRLNTPTTDSDFNKWLGDQWFVRPESVFPEEGTHLAGRRT